MTAPNEATAAPAESPAPTSPAPATAPVEAPPSTVHILTRGNTTPLEHKGR